MELKLSNRYEPLFELLEDNHPQVDTVILTGGRNSQKSFAVGTFTCIAAKDYGYRALYTRYTLTSAEDSIIPEFTEKIDYLDAHSDFAITKDRINGINNNSKIVFKGIKTSSGNQTASLKSLKNFNLFVLEEAEEMPSFDQWDKIKKSIRANDVRNLNILILNPTSKVHWIFKEFYEEKGVNEGFNGIVDNVMYIHTSYLDMDREFIADNLWHDFEDKRIAFETWSKLPKADQDNSKLRKKALYYKHTIMGGWLEKSEGVIFDNWHIGDFVDTGYTLFGSDFGFSSDPTTLIKISVDNSLKRIYIQQKVCRTRMTTSDIYEAMAFCCGNTKVVADSAEPRLIDELKAKGINIIGAIKGAGSIREGIAKMLDYELVVTEDSIDVIKELNNYAWSDKKSETPIDAYNHCIDAIRYAASVLLEQERELHFGW